MKLTRYLLLLLLCLPTVLSAEVLVVTLLGTGSPRPQIERFGPSVLIEAGRQKLLFDAGRGVAQRLFQLYVPFKNADKVFITHMHYDHLVGLADLMLSGWVFQRQKPITLWGPPALDAHLENLMQAYHSDIEYRLQYSKLPASGIRYQFHSAVPGVIYDQDELKVTAFQVDHKPVVPAFGYRIDYAGRSVVISGDTRYSEAVLKQAKGVDLLIHEAATASDSLQTHNPRLRKILDYHTSPEELARLLSAAKPKLVVLTHLLNFGVDEQTVLEQVSRGHAVPVKLGKDLMAFDISDSIREYTRSQ